jgi:DegV family protein with EDD domain
MTAIAYLDGPRLRRSLLAAAAYLRDQRGHLDRINVFPVPDGDTGTNLALTLESVAQGLVSSRERDVGAVAGRAADGAVLGARGNSGMLMSHFLLGLADALSDRDRIVPLVFAEAIRRGADAVEGALESPVEGTIVTVIRDTAKAATGHPGDDFLPLLERMVDAAQASLARTPELLPVLLEAGVVDAGAQGFVHLLEGVLGFVRGEHFVPRHESELEAAANELSAVARTAFPEGSQPYHYCTEGLVRGSDLPDRDHARATLGAFGDSLIVIRSGGLLKVHVHTDDPQAVFDVLEGWGTLEARKAEDMRAQHDAAERGELEHVALARRSVAVVTDSACDLPDHLLEAHHIRVVPLELVEEGRTYRDRVDVTAESFHARLGRSGALPTTSQPAPAAFLEAFREASAEAEDIVGVFVGSTLSGTLAAARSAGAHFHGASVQLADSLGASLLEGLLVLKAAELAEAGWSADEIVREVARIRSRSGILFTIKSFDRLLASGRVSLGRAFLGRLLGLKPILGVDVEGRVSAVGKARGTAGARAALMRRLEAEIGDCGGRLRFGVVHVGAPELLAEVSDELRRSFGHDVEILTAPATPVLATHLGIGAWGVAWMVDEVVSDSA